MKILKPWGIFGYVRRIITFSLAFMGCIIFFPKTTFVTYLFLEAMRKEITSSKTIHYFDMTVRHLDFFLAEKRLIQTDQMSVLKGIRLGVDGYSWMRKLLGRDPNSWNVGVLPWNWRATILHELSVFKEFEIVPVFIFPGLHPVKKQNSSVSGLEQGPQDWESSNRTNILNYVCDNMLSPIFSLLDEEGIEFIRAPYLTWPQLAYLASPKRNFFHTIYGSSDMFMFEVDRIILSFDFQNRSFNWVDKTSILHDLKMNDDQFLDVCLLSGLESYCPTFPPLAEPFNFQSICNIIRQFKSGLQAIQMYAEHPSMSLSYPDTFCRTRCLVKFHLIMNEEGRVEALNHEYAPNDMHEVIGNRLPSLAYLCLCHGILSPMLLNIYLHGSFLESIPSVVSKSRVFVSAVKEYLPTRSQTLHLIGSNLHSYFRKRNVFIRFENEKDLKSVPISHDFEPSLDSQLKWNVPESFKFSGKDVQVSALVRYLSGIKPGTLILKEGESYEIKTTDQALATLLCHFLELRSYVDIDHSLTSKCRLFLNLKNVPLRDEESLLLAMELIRSKLLVSKSYDEVKGANINESSPTNELKYERLFLRTLCLINATPSSASVRIQGESFSQAVHEFLGTVSYVDNCLGQFFQALYFNQVCHGRIKGSLEGVMRHLPFNRSYDGSMAYLFHHFLKDKSSFLGDLNNSSKLKDSYRDWKESLLRGFSHWENIMQLVNLLHREREIRDPFFDDFTATDGWVRSEIMTPETISILQQKEAK